MPVNKHYLCNGSISSRRMSWPTSMVSFCRFPRRMWKPTAKLRENATRSGANAGRAAGDVECLACGTRTDQHTGPVDEGACLVVWGLEVRDLRLPDQVQNQKNQIQPFFTNSIILYRRLSNWLARTAEMIFARPSAYGARPNTFVSNESLVEESSITIR